MMCATRKKIRILSAKRTYLDFLNARLKIAREGEVYHGGVYGKLGWVHMKFLANKRGNNSLVQAPEAAYVGGPHGGLFSLGPTREFPIC